MFFNHNNDEHSTASRTTDGADIESKRSLLIKLHHAAYCSHEGYTYDNLCTEDHLCCASKRLFQHMSSCTDSQCDVPCCKNSRRIWKHYRKCRHIKNCPLCCGVPTAFTPEGIAMRFSKLSSTASNVAIHTAKSPPSSAASVDGFSISNTSGFTSTAAVVSPSHRAPGGKESSFDDIGGGSVLGSNKEAQIPWEDNRQMKVPKQPTSYRQQLIPPTPPTPPTYHANNSLPPKPVTPTPYNVGYRTTTDSPKLGVGASHKPPLSPRRPEWALF